MTTLQKNPTKWQLDQEKICPDLKSFREWSAQQKMLLKAKTLIFLKGPLGAGKTEFVKSLLAAFGLSEVVSPTFALQSHYALPTGLTLEHWDLYRLEGEDDLESSGFWDQFMNPNYCVMIEWPEKISKQNLPLGGHLYKIEITVMGDGRKVQIFKRV